MMARDLDLTFRRERRAALGRSTREVGVDFVEVDASDRWARRARLLVHFVPSDEGVERRALPEAIGPANIRLLGGAGQVEPQIAVHSVEPGAQPNVLVVNLTLGEDHAELDDRTFVLELADLPNVDRFFGWAPFALGHAVPDGLAGTRSDGAPPGARLPDHVDYLARDYASFRRLMFDRLSVLAPSWTERSPADMGTALVELLAYAADNLSYYQDAVATEAYLGTARRRVSVARHARLVGYHLHEGCNARVWAQVLVAEDGVTLPRGTALVSRMAEEPLLPPGSILLEEAVERRAAFFETMYPVELFAGHNDIRFHSWGAHSWFLRRGATAATLRGHFPRLRAGDVLVLEEVVGRHSGAAADAITPHRHAVRLDATPRLSVDTLYDQPVTEISWLAEDALPFDICAVLTSPDGGVVDAGRARGNIVLADHGRTVEPEELALIPAAGRYRPALHRGDLVFAAPFDAEAERARPASGAIRQDPRDALPAVTVVGRDPQTPADSSVWTPVHDLTRSGRFARDFVVEVDDRGRPWLRFGDGTLGRRPTYGRRMFASYRVGNGPQGNVDADALYHVVMDDGRILGARNFLPGRGGAAAESVERARVYAPQLVARQESCVAAEDYAAAARRLPEVRAALARLRWTGSWHTVELFVQRSGGRPADSSFLAAVQEALEPLRLASHELELRGPRFVSLDIALGIHLAPATPREIARRALLEAFGGGYAADGRPGFFHADSRAFGEAIHLSQLVARAMEVPGVVAVDWTAGGRLQRWGRPSRGELEAGVIELGPTEVARVANDPLAPELGTVSFDLLGGRT